MINIANKLYVGNNIDVLKTFPDNIIDSIITDPPYGLTSIVKRFGKKDSAPAKYGKDGVFSRVSKGFMGQEWDGSGIEYSIELWSECLRVAKPGAILMAFGGTRTYHRIASAIEDAGWEIRDMIMWTYGSGFPKAYDISKGIDKKLGVKRKKIQPGNQPGYQRNIGNTRPWMDDPDHKIDSNEAVTELAKQWNGWKTALKPSIEPIVVAQKPIDGTNVENAIVWGVVGFNIDGGRIGDDVIINQPAGNKPGGNSLNMSVKGMPQDVEQTIAIGRYPANTILGCFCEDEDNHDDDCPIKIMDEQSGYKALTGKTYDYTGQKEYSVQGFIPLNKPNSPSNRGDSGGASRFFYCAKASKAERNKGLEKLPKKQKIFNGKSNESSKDVKDVEQRFTTQPQQNFHPTVKPLKLMEYLCTLTKTPTGGIVLDPFAGSGTTLLAARNVGRDFVGIELSEDYARIADARLQNG